MFLVVAAWAQAPQPLQRDPGVTAEREREFLRAIQKDPSLVPPMPVDPRSAESRQPSVPNPPRLDTIAELLRSLGFTLAPRSDVAGQITQKATLPDGTLEVTMSVSKAAYERQTSQGSQTLERRDSGLTFAISPQSSKRVWFKVYAHAQNPQNAWFGSLCNEATGVQTSIIVDFGKEINLGKDDRMEGVYLPTNETGNWNSSPYRIYKLKGDFKFVDPLSVK